MALLRSFDLAESPRPTWVRRGLALAFALFGALCLVVLVHALVDGGTAWPTLFVIGASGPASLLSAWTLSRPARSEEEIWHG